MSSDLSIGSFDEDDFGVYRESFSPHCSREENFHTLVHPAMTQSCHRFHATVLTESGQPITQAYRSSVLRVNSRPSKGGSDDDSTIEVQGKVTYSWGGANGSSFSGQVDASYQNRQNYVKAEAELKSNGEGNVSASAGLRKDNTTSRSK